MKYVIGAELVLLAPWALATIGLGIMQGIAWVGDYRAARKPRRNK